MTSATERLRALLDEREADYRVSATGYSIDIGPNMTAYANRTDTTLDVSLRGFTPEQAIDATLGRGTCHFEQIPEALYDDIECSECGVALWGFQMDIAGEGCPTRPRYCPNCGSRVVYG